VPGPAAPLSLLLLRKGEGGGKGKLVGKRKGGAFVVVTGRKGGEKRGVYPIILALLSGRSV